MATQISSTTGSTGIAPAAFLWADRAPLGWAPYRDARVARALRIRLTRIEEEIAALEHSHDSLTEALREVELRVARSCWGGRA